MIYFLAAVAAIAGFLFGYDEGVIAVARPLLDKDLPMGPLVGGFMTAAVPLGALCGGGYALAASPSYVANAYVMAVPKSGTALNCLRVSIQGPGRGRRRVQAGLKLRSR